MSRAVDDDFSQCMVSNTRMAARAVTRRYDAYLRPFGVTATQFSLLGGIMQMAGATVSASGERRGSSVRRSASSWPRATTAGARVP